MIGNKLDYNKVWQYETFIIVGIIIALFAFLNVFRIAHINSDFFWALAGLGLIVQGIVERHKWKETKKSMLQADKYILRKRRR